MRKLAIGMLLLGWASFAAGQDFRREGTPEQRARKDPLEGQPPPALEVEGWMNTDAALSLQELRGQVVVLDFWGTW